MKGSTSPAMADLKKEKEAAVPNRFQVNQHEIAYKFIAARDGEYCLVCRKKPPAVKLQIDHADNNRDNWDPDNLHLLCRTDNMKLQQMTVQEHKKYISYYSAKNECASARGRTHTIKEMVEYREASPEMRANSYFETQFREWLLTTIRNNGFIIKKEAVYSGAEVVGCNPTTALRYLGKLTSSVGNLKESRDATGTIIITFKQPVKPVTTNGRHNGRGKGDIADTVPLAGTELSEGKRGDRP